MILTQVMNWAHIHLSKWSNPQVNYMGFAFTISPATKINKNYEDTSKHVSTLVATKLYRGNQSLRARVEYTSDCHIAWLSFVLNFNTSASTSKIGLEISILIHTSVNVILLLKTIHWHPSKQGYNELDYVNELCNSTSTLFTHPYYWNILVLWNLWIQKLIIIL